MVDDTTQFNIIFFYRECALCRQFLDPEDVNSFLAVSACHPSPGRAEWKEIDWSHLLCIATLLLVGSACLMSYLAYT